MRGEKRTGYFVYLLECKDKTLYTGITTDVARRMEEHKKGTGSHYTRAKKFSKLLYSEAAASRSAALKREAAIKRLTRREKLAIAARPKGRRRSSFGKKHGAGIIT